MSENEDRFNHRNCADHDFAQNRLANGTFLAYSAGLMTVLSDIPTDRPVLIAGPTASGKSDLALELACRYGGVIINADALQVFANWRVLSARPSAEDEAAAPHQLYGHVPGDAEYSVGHWLREVAPFLKERARPIIVGGTGLYFRALTEGLVDIPSTPPEIRAAGDRMRLSSGLDTMLAQIDKMRLLADAPPWLVGIPTPRGARTSPGAWTNNVVFSMAIRTWAKTKT